MADASDVRQDDCVPEPSFTLVQLRYFAAAAELGSMTAAARELCVSQSAISTAVAQLEKELGVQLLLRHHARGLTLTAAGSSFFQELRSFLVHAGELAESAREAGGALVGDLSVGCFSTLAPFHLPGLLAAYEGRYPQVHITLVEGEHAQLKRALRDGSCELGLMYAFDLEDDIDRVLVDSARPYAIVAADHPLARRKQVSLHELAPEPMVLLDLPYSNAYFESIIASTGLVPHVRFRTSGYETVRALVANGHGYALLNQRPAHPETYDGQRVVSLALAEELPPLEIVLAWMQGVRLTRRAQTFIQLGRELYAGRSPRGS
jgi:DNA-binding transcriptional LysR family regulator